MKPTLGLASSLLALQILSPAVLWAQTINTSWNGATSSDWTTPSNWSGGSVPSGVVVAVNTTTGNLATISTAVPQQASWVVVANVAAGTMNMPGGSLTVNGEFDVGNGNGGTGIFNMSGGSLTVNSWIVIGRLNGTANGTVTLTGGTLTKTGGGNFNMGEGTIESKLNVSNATVNIASGELWVGQTGKAALTLGAGGAITVNNWAVIGRANGTGVFNITGGSFTKTGTTSHFVIGNGTGTINQSGGTFTTSGAELRITEAGTGLFNLTGGTTTVGIARVGNVSTGTAELRISGTGAMTASEVNIGNTGSVSGTVNLSGGTLTTNSITAGGSSGTKTFNFNGGTLTPGASGTDFYNNSAPIRTNVRDGGAKIDTAGYDITISEALEHSNVGGDLATDGGLTKNGTGTLSLTGTNTYTGDTTVNAGTLSLSTADWNSPGAVRLTTGAFLDLNFSGTCYASALYADGVLLPAGDYTAANLPAFITGTGTLRAGAVLSHGIWDGGGANGNWSTAANWDFNLVPVFPLTLTFAGSARLTNTNDLIDKTVSGISFDTAAGAFEIGGNPLTLAGDIGFSGNPTVSVTQTINLDLTLDADRGLNTRPNGNLTFGGIISGTGVLSQTGAGAVTLNGSGNSVTGLVVNGGTMNVADVGSLEVNGEMWVANGTGGTGTFNSAGTLTVANGLVVGRTGGAVADAAGTLNLTGGFLTKTGVGNVNIGEGTLQSTCTVSNDAQMELVTGELWVGQLGNGVLTLTDNAAITANNWVVVGRGGAGVLNITGGTFTKQGSNHFVVGNGSGTVNQSGGILTTNGADLRIAELGTGLFNLTGGSATIGIARVGSVSSGAAELRISGTGAMTASEVILGYAGSQSGTVNLNGGTLTTNSIIAGASSGTQTFNFNGGTLKPGASGTGFFDNSAAIRSNVRDGGAKIDTAEYDITIAEALEHSNLGGDLAIDGGLTKNGTGTLSLAGSSTYTGNTTVASGTLNVANNSATTFADTSTVSIVSGAVLNLPNAETDTVASLVVNGSALAAGIYDASTPATAGFITGTGKLQVGATSGYSSWAATHVSGALANTDTDLDGVQNGVEYFMNSATGFTTNPAVVVSAGPVRTVTWPNGGNIPFNDYGTQFKVQTSTDLGIWTNVLSGDPNLNNTSGSVAYTLPIGADKVFIRLLVTPN